MRSVPIGTQKEWGVELEASYHNENTRIAISHAYTKLLDFDLDPQQTTYITAEPHGFGDDLTHWSNNITKITALHNLNDKWSVNGSMRIYWGFPGMKDSEDYYPYSGSWGASSDAPIIEDGWKRSSRGSYYLNLGLQYKPTEDLTIGLNGYYLLGIFDKDLNKRTYIPGNGAFRSHTPAVAVSVSYKF
jgi:iron complex outermembrane receptor protein